MQDLFPDQGLKPGPPALGAWNLSDWTTREVPEGQVLTTGLPGSPNNPFIYVSAFFRLYCSGNNPHILVDFNNEVIILATCYTNPPTLGQSQLLACDSAQLSSSFWLPG